MVYHMLTTNTYDITLNKQCVKIGQRTGSIQKRRAVGVVVVEVVAARVVVVVVQVYWLL